MSTTAQADSQPRPESSDPLPPVEPPSARFLLQLFLIPLLIVMIIVAVWLVFSQLTHLGSDPKTLVSDLRRMNQASWQKAMTLADVLRNPENDTLKDDAALASDLASLLTEQIQAGSLEKNSVKMRMYLCRTLGEFRTPVVTEALCLAANTDRDADSPNGIEINVRLSALEAIALLAGNVGAENLRDNREVIDALFAAAKEKGDTADADRRKSNVALEASVGAKGESLDRLDLQTPRAELRAGAAFAMGMIGGPECLDRLAFMTENDAYPNARYNAATGLARHGDIRALPTLVDMLNPKNEEAVRDETGDAERAWKRVLLFSNGVRASRQLHKKNPDADYSGLVQALQELEASSIRGVPKVEITDLLRELKSS